AYAVKYGLAERAPTVSLISEQGTKMGRPSQIHIELTYGESKDIPERIEVGGSVMPVLSGALSDFPSWSSTATGFCPEASVLYMKDAARFQAKRNPSGHTLQSAWRIRGSRCSPRPAFTWTRRGRRSTSAAGVRALWRATRCAAVARRPA